MPTTKLNFPIDISESTYQIKQNPENQLYVLLMNGKPLQTPGGFNVEHRSERLLLHIQAELEGEDELNPANLNLYSLYCTCKEFFEAKTYAFSIEKLRDMLLADVSLRPCAGPEKAYQFEKWHPLTKFLSDHNLKHPDLVQTDEDMETWINSMGPECEAGITDLTDLMFSEFNVLSAAQKTVIINTINLHSSFMFGYFIATKKCTELEFASGLLAAHCVLPGVFDEITRSEYKKGLNGIMRDAQVFSDFVHFSFYENQDLLKINHGH